LTAGAAEARPAPAPRLIRAIGRWDLVAVIVNSIIGSGIFGLPAAVAGLTGAWSPLAFVLAALGMLTVVLCFAEVASRFEETGGPYVWVGETFGPLLGFQVGWLHVWTRLLTGAAVLNLVLSSIAQIAPAAGTPWARLGLMTVVLALVTITNVVGIRQATWTVDVFTVAKLFPLLLLIAAGLLSFRGEVLATQVASQPRWGDAIVLLVFAYAGFESAVIAGGETRDPRGDTGFALVTAMAVVSLVYCLVQLAIVGVVAHASATAVPVAIALGTLLGPAGMILGSLGAAISGYGWLTGFGLMTPRILYSMGERGELPRVLGRIHPRFRTPHVAIVLNSAVTLGLGLAGTFAGAATLSVVTRLGIFALVCAALPVLRARRREAPGFRLRGGPAVAAAGIGFCVWALLSRSVEQIWLLGVIIALGFVARWLGSRGRRSMLDSGSADIAKG
jgi:basic amino acid/polyamine antiporter, APA family